MTWTELLTKKCVTADPTTKGEMDNLRSIVTRSLANMNFSGLATDIRFILAYDAARTLSLMIVRAEGYRPRSVGGHSQHLSRIGGRGPGVFDTVGLLQ